MQLGAQFPASIVKDSLRTTCNKLAHALRMYDCVELAKMCFDLTDPTGREDATKFFTLPRIPESMRATAPFVPSV